MKVQFRLNAGPHERFTDSFARSLIGQTPRLNIRQYEDGPILSDHGTATVVDAEVIEDGVAVLITYETPDAALDLANMVSAGLLAAPTDTGMSFLSIPAEPAAEPTCTCALDMAEDLTVRGFIKDPHCPRHGDRG